MTFYGDLRSETAASEDFASTANAPSAATVFPPAIDRLDLTALDDAALMREVGKGSVDAFSVLVDRHSSALYRVAMRMLADAAEAEDVLQDCFARLWQNAPRWSPSGAGLVGWLHRVAMNLCFDRKRRFRVVTVDTMPDPADDAALADRRIEADQAARAVAAALDDLPERYRAALVLCYYEGFSNALAAEVLDLNIKAMESLLFRARRQMRTLLEARDVACADLEAQA
ncbi:RNA polymerase sigma-70 factor, ECF subfamily [Novosphingobium sp. B1]|nr:RNA polymerase sigma-70 factor, ECF subfamily [Novosphingobium sp. B1]